MISTYFTRLFGTECNPSLVRCVQRPAVELALLTKEALTTIRQKCQSIREKIFVSTWIASNRGVVRNTRVSCTNLDPLRAFRLRMTILIH